MDAIIEAIDPAIVHQGYYFGHPEPVDRWLEKWMNAGEQSQRRRAGPVRPVKFRSG